MSEKVLTYPDYGQELILETDASNVGLGAILTQVDRGIRETNSLCLKNTANGRKKL